MVLVVIDCSRKSCVNVFVDEDGEGPRLINSIGSRVASIKYMIRFLSEVCSSARCGGSDLCFDCPEWAVDVLRSRFWSGIVRAYCEGRVTVDDLKYISFLMKTVVAKKFVSLYKGSLYVVAYHNNNPVVFEFDGKTIRSLKIRTFRDLIKLGKHLAGDYRIRRNYRLVDVLCRMINSKHPEAFLRGGEERVLFEKLKLMC